MSKKICLGTAMWGWNVDEKTAFKFLDIYYQNGGRYIDSAFNYPINGVKDDLCFSINVISEWIKVNKISDLKVIFKYGSINNENNPENDLSTSRTQEMCSFAYEKLGCNLYSLMIHWDNRTDHTSIDKTVLCLEKLSKEYGFSIGLSGIKEIDYYLDSLNKLNVESVDHEVKHAFNTTEKTFINNHVLRNYRLWAYGISGSGLKLNEQEYRADSYVKLTRENNFHRENFTDKDKDFIRHYIEKSKLVNNLYEYAMLVKERDPRFYGYIVSPSKISQLEQIISFREKLQSSIG